MNSTGLDLETSDLVRNYMLMGCPMAEQNTLYADYWLAMERVLGSLSFDAFLHDWMVVTLQKPVPKGRAMYSEFKRFAADSSMPRMERTRGLLENMLEYAGYYAAIKGSRLPAAATRTWTAVSPRSKPWTALLRIRCSCTCSRHGSMNA